jgi:hypothetical protein
VRAGTRVLTADDTDETDEELICGRAGGGRRRRSVDYLMHPLPYVPIEDASNRWGFIGEEYEGGIELEKCFWKRPGFPSADDMSRYRADAQDVKHRQSEQPKLPGADETPRFGGLRGCGLALVCGGFGHCVARFHWMVMPAPRVPEEAGKKGGFNR